MSSKQFVAALYAYTDAVKCAILTQPTKIALSQIIPTLTRLNKACAGIIAYKLYTMPKIKEAKSAFIRRISAEYPNVFRCDDSVLFCLMCDEKLNADQNCQVTQHIKTVKHTTNVQRKTKTGQNKNQSLLTNLQSSTNNVSSNNFAMDLTRAFLESNIALHKIANPSIVNFIEKHTKFAAPNETTLRRKCVPVLYNECIEKMKEIAAGKYLWVSIDESTDSEQRCIANFVFGVLGEPDRCYLFASQPLEVTNSNSVAAFFDTTINDLGVDKKNILLAITDAAPYMVCAMNALKVLYPKMIHVTCLAHGMHRVADFIKGKFKDVNDLISNVKKIFRKVIFRFDENWCQFC